MPGMDAPIRLCSGAASPDVSAVGAIAFKDPATSCSFQLTSGGETVHAQAGERIASIEILRILAAFGIVWFHIPAIPGKSLGYAGLPVFLILTFLFVPVLFSEKERRGFLGRRTIRLLIPWALWSAIYLPIFLARGVANDWNSLGPLWFLAGTAQHLWFLPFAWLFGILAAGLMAEFARLRSKMQVAILLSAATGALAGSTLLLSAFQLPEPLPQWLFALPALPIGLAFAAARRAEGFHSRTMMLVAVTAVTVGACAFMLSVDEKSLALTYMIAAPVVAVALLLDRWRIRWGGSIAGITLGVYLVHPAMYTVFARLGAADLPPAALACLVFAGSLGAAMLLERTVLLHPVWPLRARPRRRAARTEAPACVATWRPE